MCMLTHRLSCRHPESLSSSWTQLAQSIAQDESHSLGEESILQQYETWGFGNEGALIQGCQTLKRSQKQ